MSVIRAASLTIFLTKGQLAGHNSLILLAGTNPAAERTGEYTRTVTSMRPAPPALILLLSGLLTGATALAQQSIQLRVTATIPPRPCEYPRPCEPVPAGTTSKVTVDEQTVSYLGSPPDVRRDGDLLIVKF